MLDPDYLLRISEGGEEIAEAIHSDILNKIIERIALRLDRGDDYILTAQDKWQIEVLQESGLLLEDVQKILAQSTGLMQTEIAEAMEDAGVKALDYDDAVYKAAGLSPTPLTQSPYLIRLMQRTYEATMGDWTNFTRTTAEAAQQAFIKACDKAYTQVSSGSLGYSQAFVDAVNDMVSAGINVTYPSGHVDTIETATLRCIRTGVSQATAQITDARMEEMDWDIILVSSHLGARVTDAQDFTNHAWWQGKSYSKSGKDARFPPYSVCGEGNVQGIHGANCCHSHGPGDGEFNPYDQYDSEENQKEYDLQQRQRTLERRIRKSKREVMGYKTALDNASTDEAKALVEHEYQKASALLQKRNKAYNDFCEENNLKKLNERITIAKWDRSQAAKARAAAKRWENRVKIHEARSSDTFHVVPPDKGDAIKAQSLYKELHKSDVGRNAYKYIMENNVFVSVKYDGPENLRGRAFGRFIAIYANETKSVKMTTKTIIHEVTHLQLNRQKYTQWEEAYCYAQELKHEKNELTWKDLRAIIKWAKENYPEYPWR